MTTGPVDALVPSRTRVALALGSGGARGYAHIGAIEVLEARGFEIICIAGSSMGALVGGLHAAGKLSEFAEWARGLNQLDVLRMLDPSISAPGAIRAGKIFAKVRDLFDGALIEDLAIPFTAVATDLLARKEVWFQSGPVAVAVRASIAIPSVITPVVLNGRLLADGGLMNPVPIAPTVSSQADATIAVSLGGERREAPPGPPVKETAAQRPVEEWADRFRRTASSLLDRDVIRSITGRFSSGVSSSASEMYVEVDDLFEALPPGLGKGDVIAQSIEAMQTVLTRYRLAGYPPDVLVSIPRDACRSRDFHRAADMIDVGRSATEAALDLAGVSATHPN